MVADIGKDLAFREPSLTFKVADQGDQSSLSAIPPSREVCALKSRVLCHVLGLATSIFVLLSSLRFMHFPSPPSLSSLFAAPGPQCPGDSFGGSHPEACALFSDSRMASRPSKPPTVIMRSLRTGTMLTLREGPCPPSSSQSHASPQPHSSPCSPPEPRVNLPLSLGHAQRGSHAFHLLAPRPLRSWVVTSTLLRCSVSTGTSASNLRSQSMTSEDEGDARLEARKGGWSRQR